MYGPLGPDVGVGDGEAALISAVHTTKLVNEHIINNSVDLPADGQTAEILPPSGPIPTALVVKESDLVSELVELHSVQMGNNECLKEKCDFYFIILE